MLTQEKAHSLLDTTAAPLMAADYADLHKVAQHSDQYGYQEEIVTQVDGETVHIATMIQPIDYIRSRVCVELTLWTDSMERDSPTPSIYFERFSNGRLYVQGGGGTDVGVLGILPYIVIGGSIIGLVLSWFASRN